MEWISFRNMPSWFADEFREFFDDFGILLATGLVALAGGALVNAPLQLGATLGGMGAAIAIVLTYTLGEGLVDAILYSVAKARLHGRRPMVRDFLPSPWVVLHLGALKAVTAAIVLGLLLLLSGPAVLAAIQGIRTGANPFEVVRSFLPSLVLLLLLVWILSLLTLFSPALVVDRRVHFGHALMYSADCVWRDPLGLALFMLLLGLLKVTLTFLAACGTCLLIVGFIIQAVSTPLLISIRLRAYRDYFGLATDWVFDEHLTSRGHGDFVREIAQDPQLRSQHHGASRFPDR